METKANVALVHGAWADGSSWSKVIPLLQKNSLNVVAAQLPLTSVEADIAVTKNLLGMLKGPVVLVGHFYGGIVISGGRVRCWRKPRNLRSGKFTPLG